MEETETVWSPSFPLSPFSPSEAVATGKAKAAVTKTRAPMTLDINTQVRKMLVELGDKTFKCWTKGLGSKRIYAGVTGEIYLR